MEEEPPPVLPEYENPENPENPEIPENVEPEVPKKRKRGRPKKSTEGASLLKQASSFILPETNVSESPDALNRQSGEMSLRPNRRVDVRKSYRALNEGNFLLVS